MTHTNTPAPWHAATSAALDALALQVMAQDPAWWPTFVQDRYTERGACLVRQGGKPEAYGSVALPGTERVARAHRVAVLHDGRPIPYGYVVDHLCMVPGCVRADHLEPVTTSENIKRAHQAHGAALEEAAAALGLDPRAYGALFGRSGHQARSIVARVAAGESPEVIVAQCAVEGCQDEAHARGWCQSHYTRWRMGAFGSHIYPVAVVAADPFDLDEFRASLRAQAVAS